MKERLQKIISMAGVASRRKAEELILAGEVRVNGKIVAELGYKADPDHDAIKVRGKLLQLTDSKAYILLNKPKGFITSLSDPQGRPTVKDLLKGIRYRVYPVGRLDYDTEGLLLLTNDGDLANRMMHPSHEVEKTYVAKIKGVLEDKDVARLEGGVSLQKRTTAPTRVKLISKTKENSWVEVTLHEGRNRQVRRMMEKVGHPVQKLVRVRYAFLTLDEVPVGKYRHLSTEEVKQLRSLSAGESQQPVTAAPPREAGKRVPRPRRMDQQTFAPPRGGAKRSPTTSRRSQNESAPLTAKGKRPLPRSGRDSRTHAPRGSSTRSASPRGIEKKFSPPRGGGKRSPRPSRVR